MTREQDHPVYRAYFWEGSTSHEWRLEDVADVDEAIEWCARFKAGTPYVLYVEMDVPGGIGLIRLRGVDPTVVED